MIVEQYHGKVQASKAEEKFEKVFKEKSFPEDAPLIAREIKDEKISLVQVLSQVTSLAKSNSDARRKIQEGAVEVDGVRVADIEHQLAPGKEYRIRLGKKFAKVFLRKKT